MTPLEIVQTATRLINEGRIDEALAYHAPDVEMLSPDTGSPAFRRHVGVDALRRSLERDIHGAQVQFNHRRYVVQGDTVAVEAVNRGTFGGRPVEQPVAIFFDVCDGRIAAIRTYYNRVGLKREAATPPADG